MIKQLELVSLIIVWVARLLLMIDSIEGEKRFGEPA